MCHSSLQHICSVSDEIYKCVYCHSIYPDRDTCNNHLQQIHMSKSSGINNEQECEDAILQPLSHALPQIVDIESTNMSNEHSTTSHNVQVNNSNVNGIKMC